MELKDIIKQACTNRTIDYISFEQKNELQALYMEHYGRKLDISCPRCIMTACIELGRVLNDKEVEYGKEQGKKRGKRTRGK